MRFHACVSWLTPPAGARAAALSAAPEVAWPDGSGGGGRRSLLLAALAVACLPACAGLPGTAPLKVDVVGLEPLRGEGMELRFAVKLRLQNPGESAVDFDGVALDLDLRDQSFASGVSTEKGTLPRYGEMLLNVPVTVSAPAMLRQALQLGRDGGIKGPVSYRLRGRLGGSMLGGRRFESTGQVDWPPTAAGTSAK